MLKFLILLFLFSSASKALTVTEFRRLALEMVTDLQRAFGPSYSDNGIFFDLNEYRNLILNTKIESKKDQIENNYKTVNSIGEEITVKEKVDAINYFPKENLIIYNETVWNELLIRGRINELKLMIHHEFVPYFIKKMDRNHLYSKKLQEIYTPRLSFEKIKPGFYEIMNFDDPIFSQETSIYWIYVEYNPFSKELYTKIVENPRKGLWCLDCYLLPSENIKIESTNKSIAMIYNQPVVLSAKQGAVISIGFKDEYGYPYIKMLSEDSFGFGFMDKSFKGTLENWSSQNTKDSKLVVLTRVSDVENVNWLKPNKKIPINGIMFTKEDQNCEVVRISLETTLIDLCNKYKDTILKNITYNSCNPENVNIQDVKKGKSNKILDSYRCGYVGNIEAAFTGIPSRFKSYYYDIIQQWNLFLDKHKLYSQ